MKAFIFAAGFGERLRPVTDSLPKPLVPVLNVPAVCYSLMLLREAGINEVICNLHYKYEYIVSFFHQNENFGFDISFSIEKDILGTGGGLKKCEKFLDDDEFVIINSDVIADIDLKDIIDSHHKRNAPATLALKKSAMAKSLGPVGIKSGNIIDFGNILSTGAVSDYLYTGISVYTPEIFRYLKPEFSSIVDTGFTELIKKNFINYTEHNGMWHDIGSLIAFRKANMACLSAQKQFMKKYKLLNINFTGPVSPDASVHETSVIKNSIIGKEAVIEKDANIVNSVVLPGAVVKEGTEVKDAVVYDNEVLGAV